MSKSIFITGNIPVAGFNLLKQKDYVVDVNNKNKILNQKELISFLKKKDYDAVLTSLTDKIDSKVINLFPSVKIYANYATGYDNIDLKLTKEKGIVVTNAPTDFSAEAVAEHTIAMMMALATRIVEADKFVRQGKYKGWEPMNFIGLDVVGKTIGLIGAGDIGELVSKYAKGLGMNVVYTDIKRNQNIEEKYEVKYLDSVDDVLKVSDFVSLHVPLLDSTRHLINEERLKLMKPTSFLINTARGPVIDENALEKALRNKVIAGAALDVFEFEPKVVPGLLKLDNVVLSPHIASASIDARNDMAKTAAGNIIDLFEGRAPKNVVN